MEKAALLIIDAQQECFAPIGKLVLPDGPKAIARIAQALDWARPGSLNGFLAAQESEIEPR